MNSALKHGISKSIFAISLGVVFALLICCCLTSLSAEASAKELYSSSPENIRDEEVLAIVGTAPITREDVEAQIEDRLLGLEFKQQKQKYQLIESELKKTVQDHLLSRVAAKNGISTKEFLTAEIDDGLTISDEDVEEWYQQNSDRFDQVDLEEFFPKIRDYLYNTERNRRLHDLLKELEAEQSVVYSLEPIRANLDLGNSPILGSEKAIVTIAEFLDFECPFCRQFSNTLKKIKQKYGDQLRFVYLQYPLSIHQDAFRLSEVALCAYQQGKFSEMHDYLFRDSTPFSTEQIKVKSSELELNMAQFETCLDQNLPSLQIQDDIRQGTRWGVEGTPTIFVNGIPVQDNVLSYNKLVEVIDSEIERVELNG